MYIENLIARVPALDPCKKDIVSAVDAIIRCFEHGGKLLLCGNGGSAADCEHIVGELMKGFLSLRPLDDSQIDSLKKSNPEISDNILQQLQGALPAISLTGSPSLSTAFANDVNPDLVFAQQVYGLGKSGDILICISTSGNAKNVVNASSVAKAIGMTTIALAGMTGGRLKDSCNISIVVPAIETYAVQELHLPVYHAICAEVEKYFFG